MVITNLITELAITYFELQALDNQLEILDETITLQQDALDIVQVQNEVGTANVLAVEQYEAQLLNIKNMKLAIQQAITENESKINFLSGRYPQPVFRDTISGMKQVIQTGIPSDLLKYRPDIRQAEYELAATKADVKAAKAAFYPTINITGSLGLQAFRTSLMFTTPESIAYGIFGNLAAPLLNRSAIKAEFRRANASQIEALYNYQKAILNGYVEVHNELARIKRLDESYVLKKRQTEILTNSINTSSELYNTGRANYLEVLIAQQNALQAKLELVETKKNQMAAMVNVYKALGGGWE
jgi:NodT family efflux transporter outer membrane factor (OMF) lipoprotein